MPSSRGGRAIFVLCYFRMRHARIHSISFVLQNKADSSLNTNLHQFLYIASSEPPALTTIITLGGSPGVDGPRCRGSGQS